MNERAIFLAALECTDPKHRTAYLRETCGDDLALRQRIEALLRSHEKAGSFLNMPAVEQVARQGGHTVAINAPPTSRSPESEHHVPRSEAPSLDFLAPSQKPGVLGRLDHYEVLELIGKGGMGIVLKAQDEKLHRLVAIKVLAPQLATSDTARARFVREARAAAAVCHENVITIHAVEPHGQLPYLAMQYVAGCSVQHKVDRLGPLGIKEILRISLQTARGLAEAHKQGLIHRDISPANILLENGVERVRITDFGLARAADDASLTQSGVVAGTPHYMSPEQALGLAIDQRSDLFSLGSVMYTMCTGRPAFSASTSLAVLRRVSDDMPRPIRDVNPDIPDWLCDIITRLHAKNPGERFQTASEVATLLEEHLAEEQQGATAVIRRRDRARATAPVASGATPRMRRKRWALLAATLLLAVAGLGFTEATGVTNLGGTVVRFFSPDGTLVVQIDDPGVSVSIDGEELVISGAGAKEIRVKPGPHTVRATKDGQSVMTKLVEVKKAGKAIVSVRREDVPPRAGPPPRPGAVPAFGTFEDDFELAVRAGRGKLSKDELEALRAEGQAVAVQLADPIAAKLLKVFGRLSGSAHQRLFEGGCIKWKLADLGPETRTAFETAVLAAQPGTSLKGADVGFAMVESFEAKKPPPPGPGGKKGPGKFGPPPKPGFDRPPPPEDDEEDGPPPPRDGYKKPPPGGKKGPPKKPRPDGPPEAHDRDPYQAGKKPPPKGMMDRFPGPAKLIVWFCLPPEPSGPVWGLLVAPPEAHESGSSYLRPQIQALRRQPYTLPLPEPGHDRGPGDG